MSDVLKSGLFATVPFPLKIITEFNSGLKSSKPLEIVSKSKFLSGPSNCEDLIPISKIYFLSGVPQYAYFRTFPVTVSLAILSPWYRLSSLIFCNFSLKLGATLEKSKS